MVLMLLFRLYEKVTKRDFFTFFLLLQKNQKADQGPRPSGLPGCGSKFRAYERFAKMQTLCLSRNFVGNRGFVPYSSEHFEPVRKGDITAQGFVGIYEKASFDLGGQ